jgi:AraC-like DNA-binding protein
VTPDILSTHLMKNSPKNEAPENAVTEAMQGLAGRIARHTRDGDLKPSAVPGLSLFQRYETTGPISLVYAPSICLIARGAKSVRMGDADFCYGPSRYLLTSVTVPTVAQITKASREESYLGLRLELNVRDLARLMTDTRMPGSQETTDTHDRGIAVGALSLPLVEAFHRLIDLLDDPDDIPMLSPVIQTEIFYRLLVGDHGMRLRQIVSKGTHSQQIAMAIEWLHANYKRQLRIEELAERVNMSVSTFHHHFREMTAFTPLRFQKQLRLQEARRLMLSDHLDASSAAYEVGYESASQFGREYKALFGVTPGFDIKQLRGKVSL